MCLVKEKEIESNNSIYGLIQLLISTHIPFSGTLNALCKYFYKFDTHFNFFQWEFINDEHVCILIECSFSVDGTPIREFKNMESKGVAFPKNQAMRIYSSLWNADDWATRGGLVKTDWNEGPFIASYRNFNADASSSNAWYSQQLDSTRQQRLSWVQKNYMIYNYCNDTKRFPQGLPTECTPF